MTDEPLLPIDPDELRKQFRIAIGMEIQKLPQLKGKGASTDRTQLERAVDQFADRVLERLQRGNLKFFLGTPSPGTCPTDRSGGDNVVIPVGLPRYDDLPK